MIISNYKRIHKEVLFSFCWRINLGFEKLITLDHTVDSYVYKFKFVLKFSSSISHALELPGGICK